MRHFILLVALLSGLLFGQDLAVAASSCADVAKSIAIEEEIKHRANEIGKIVAFLDAQSDLNKVGRTWADAMRTHLQNPGHPEQWLLPVDANLKETLEWLVKTFAQRREELRRSPKFNSKSIVASIIPKIAQRLEAMQTSTQVNYEVLMVTTHQVVMLLDSAWSVHEALVAYFETQIERNLANKSMIGEPSHFGLTPLFFSIPIAKPLSFFALNQTVPFGLSYAGLIDKPTSVDGIRMEPNDFFVHDLGHATDVRSRWTSNVKLWDIDISRHTLRANKPKDQDGALLIAELQERLSIFRGYERARDELSAQPRRRLMLDVVWFYLFHEEVVPLNRAYVRRRLETDLSTPGERDMLLYRLSNKADLGQAFKNPPTRQELDDAFNLVTQSLPQ